MAETKTDTAPDLEALLTKMVSKGLEEQTGVKMPTGASSLKDAVIGGVTAKLSELGGPRIARTAERIAFGVNKDAEKSAYIGRLAENTWRAGLPFLPVIYESGKKYHKSIGNYFHVGQQFSTALKAQSGHASFFTAVNSDLEVVKNERARLSHIITNDSKSMLIHALSTLPAQVGTQLDKIIKDIELQGRHQNGAAKSDDDKNPTLSDVSKQMRLRSAEKINKAFGKVLETISTEDEQTGKRKFNSMLGVLTSILASTNIKDLDDPMGRAGFLRSIKDSYFAPHIAGIASGIRKFLSSKLDVRTDKDLHKATAATMIAALEKELVKNPNATRVTLLGAHKRDESLADYIVDIFQQHQKDCGRGEIPRRVLGRMQEAAQQIAEAMLDPQRQLSPQALVLLVDKKHGIASFDKKEMVEVTYGEELDNKLATMQTDGNLSRRHKISAAKQFKNYQATREQFVQSWNNLTPEEKLMWSSFLSNEMLADMGVSKQECQQLRHRENEFWHETMEEVLLQMGQISANELRDLGLNEVQITQLMDAARSIMRGNGQYLAENRGELTDLVADAATLVDAQRPGFLKAALDRAHQRHDHKEIIKERQDNKSLVEQVMDRRGDSPDHFRS